MGSGRMLGGGMCFVGVLGVHIIWRVQGLDHGV